MLLFAQADMTTGSIRTPSVETGSIDMAAIDRVDECMVAQICIDRYLWSLYERTRKIDTIKVPEQIKVSVKRKGKTKIVTKTITKLVNEDFAWKDPDAAERAGMSPENYVIGGMDPNFRVTLYHALRALDDAGLKPGITCAFRDDYRQTIASGLKAQSDRSYHGGSFRG
ncbi:MAG TPA: peptidase M15, partial [Xanthobacteraceae bacterium]|nr:peptidase M15 [Xanthobacteraceae bacterium]